MIIRPESEGGRWDILNWDAALPILTGTVCALILGRIQNNKSKTNSYFMSAVYYGCCAFAIIIPIKHT